MIPQIPSTSSTTLKPSTIAVSKPAGRLAGHLVTQPSGWSDLSPSALIFKASQKMTWEIQTEIVQELDRRQKNGEIQIFTYKELAQLNRTWSTLAQAQQVSNVIAIEVARRSRAITQETFNPEDWSQLAMSFSRCQVYNKVVFDAITDVLTTLPNAIPLFSPKTLTQLTRSLATFSHCPLALWNRISPATRFRLYRYTWEEIASLSCSFGRFGVEDTSFRKAVTHQVQHRSLIDALPDSLAWLAWELTRWGVRDQQILAPIFQEVARRANLPTRLNEFSIRALSDLLLSAADTEFSDDDFFQSTAKASFSRLKDARSRDLCHIATACIRLNQCHSPLFQTVIPNSMQQLKEFRPTELRQIAWCTAKAGTKIPESTSKQLFERIQQQLEGSNRSDSYVLLIWCLMITRHLTPVQLKHLLSKVDLQPLQGNMHAIGQLRQIQLEAKLQQWEWPEHLRKFLKEIPLGSPTTSRFQTQVEGIASILLSKGATLQPEAVIEDTYPVDLLAKIPNQPQEIIIQVNGPKHEWDDPAELFRNDQLERLEYRIETIWWHYWNRLSAKNRVSLIERFLFPAVKDTEHKSKHTKSEKKATRPRSRKPKKTIPPLMIQSASPQKSQTHSKIAAPALCDSILFNLVLLPHISALLSGPDHALYGRASTRVQSMLRPWWSRLIRRDFSDLHKRYCSAMPHEPLDQYMYARLYQASIASGYNTFGQKAYPLGYTKWVGYWGELIVTPDGDQVICSPDDPKDSSALKISVGDRPFAPSRFDQQFEQLVGSTIAALLNYQSLLPLTLGDHQIYIVDVSSLKKHSIPYMPNLCSMAESGKFFLLAIDLLDDIVSDKSEAFPNCYWNKKSQGTIFGITDSFYSIAMDAIIANIHLSGEERAKEGSIANFLKRMHTHPIGREIQEKPTDKIELFRELASEMEPFLKSQDPFLKIASHMLNKASARIACVFQLYLKDLGIRVWQSPKLNVTTQRRQQALEILNGNTTEIQSRHFIKNDIPTHCALNACQILKKLPANKPVLITTYCNYFIRDQLEKFYKDSL